MLSSSDIRALVVTPDPALASTFVQISREFGIRAECSQRSEATPPEWQHEKYEALLIDFDIVRDPAPALAALRATPSNRGAVVLAVVSNNAQKDLALGNGANFVLTRPIDGQDLRRTLGTACEIMKQERRRYFRCTAELPVSITREDGSRLAAKTANVSAQGMSIVSAVNFRFGERIAITVMLAEPRFHVLGEGVVVWDDKHGKTGISFRCVPHMQKLLDSWLDEEFKRLREDSLRDLQAGRGDEPGD